MEKENNNKFFYELKPLIAGNSNNKNNYIMDYITSDEIIRFTNIKENDPKLLISKRFYNVLKKYNVDPFISKTDPQIEKSMKLKLRLKSKNNENIIIPNYYSLTLYEYMESFSKTQLIFKSKKGKVIITQKMLDILKKENIKIKRVELIKLDMSKKQKELLNDDIPRLKPKFKPYKESYWFQSLIIIALTIFLFFIMNASS